MDSTASATLGPIPLTPMSRLAPPSKKRGRLLLGLIAGGLAGAASASAIVRQLANAPTGEAQSPQDAPESASGGVLGALRARWREAAVEGRVAAQEATRQKLARYRELSGDDPK